MFSEQLLITAPLKAWTPLDGVHALSHMKPNIWKQVKLAYPQVNNINVSLTVWGGKKVFYLFLWFFSSFLCSRSSDCSKPYKGGLSFLMFLLFQEALLVHFNLLTGWLFFWIISLYPGHMYEYFKTSNS